jgi:hypothetical protein
MNPLRFASAVAATLLLSLLFITEARASAVRTFVASTGSDANTATNCGRTAPCRNFSAAYSVTTAGGEVVALDSAGFGGITITTAVTITAIPGEFGYINVPAASSGIVISAAVSDVVVLSNIQFSGSNAASTTGVTLNSGKLDIQNCNFSYLTLGLDAAGKVNVIDSNFRGNTTAVRATGDGADYYGSSSFVATTTSVRIDGGSYTNNTTVFNEVNPGASTLAGTSKVNIFIATFAGNYDWRAHVAGNGTVFTGSGTGCTGTCNGPVPYMGNNNPR